MVRPIMRDPLFLAQKSEPASEADKQVVQDLLDTLKANQDRCVGMAANMIGVKKNIIVVAAMALGKKAYAIHQSGKWYTDENIDQMLMERHLAKKARKGSSKNHLKGPRKRTAEDDERFAEAFERLIKKVME